MSKVIRELPQDVLEVFAKKGEEGALSEVNVKGSANGVKVRRVTQIISDLLPKPVSEARILDLACGEGVYSIELGLHGAKAVASDGRNDRLQYGIECAAQLGLDNVSMKVEDLRSVTPETHGTFDVVLFLGILYHLDANDIFPVLKTLHDLCKHVLIIDTHVSLFPTEKLVFEGSEYYGARRREHPKGSDTGQKSKHLLQSLDNEFCFLLTRTSLMKLLAKIGFTSAYEVFVPLEPGKPANRRTFVAIRNEIAPIHTYPWVNSNDEAHISRQMRQFGVGVQEERVVPHFPMLAFKALNRFLQRYGLSIQSRH